MTPNRDRHGRVARRLLAMVVLGAALGVGPRIEVVSAAEATFTSRFPVPAPAAAADPVSAAGLDDDAVAAAAEPGRLRAGEPLDAPFGAIGVTLPAEPSGPVLLRVLDESGWSDWTELSFGRDHGPDDAPATGSLGSDPIWVGAGTAYELDLPADAAAPEVHVSTEQQVRRRVVVEAEPAGAAPAIRPRSDWGAREPSQQPVIASDFQFAVVHHSVNANGYGQADVPAMLRSIQAYHMDVNGWSDVGYNFAVDRFGGMWEARAGGIDRAVVGGHAQGFNAGSTGVVVLGEFTDVDPGTAVLDAVASIISWKFAVHDVPPTGFVVHTTSGSTKYPPGTAVRIPRVIGHRDVGLTSCPGSQLYARLGAIRNRVAGWTAGQLEVRPDRRLVANAGGRWTNDNGPSMQWTAPTVLEAARKGPNGDIQIRRYTNATWSPWVSLGGAALSQPELASWGSGRLDVYAVGLDGALWSRARTSANGAFGQWTRLGGILTSAPTAISWGPGRIDVFARGTDAQLWTITFDGGAWRQWRPVGGILSSAAEVSARRPGVLDLFARGGDGQVFHLVWNGTSAIGTWENLGGFATTAPTAVAWGGERTDVFVRGIDGALWTRYWDGARWSPWYSMGGELNGAPDAGSSAPGRLDVLVRGVDGNVWARSWTGTAFTPWSGLPG